MRTERRESSEPLCPFCKGTLKRPREVRLNAMELVQSGRCDGCGALYIVDPTSKNLGEVMMQGLQLAADEIGRDLTTLVSGEDYEDEILSYDMRNHRSSGVPKSVMDGHGRLYIIKVRKK